MKKVDYQILAEAIKKHRNNALGMHAMNAGMFEKCECAQIAEAIAYTFARFAHVDEKAFLKACEIPN